MTIDDQIKYIGFEKLNAMDRLKVLIPNFHFTGSLSLLCYGVTKRPMGDLDIIVSNMDVLYRVEDAGEQVDRDFDYEIELPKESEVQLKGKIPNRAHIRLYNTDICVFYAKDEETKMFEFMAGRTFKVANPRYAIAAKESYVKQLLAKTRTEAQEARMNKHQNDINEYQKWLVQKRSHG